jgi:hypothetical protein
VRIPASAGRKLFLLVSVSFAFSVLIVFLAFSSSAQNPPLDSSEISRDLLYVAPSRAEMRAAGDVVWTAYAGTRFEYGEPLGKWLTQRSAATRTEPQKKTRVVSDFPGAAGLYELVGSSDDDRATLALRKKGTQEPLAEATLWDRDRLVEAWLPELRKQKPELTAEALRQDLEVADPEVRATAQLPTLSKSANDQAILVAAGQSAGEGELGLATIVKFEPDTRGVTVYHPADLLTCEVSAIGVSVNTRKLSSTVWFGSQAVREGVISPCGGLSQLDLQSRQTVAVTGAKNPPIGSMVTLLDPGGSLVVATDAGICNLQWNTEDSWDCWRFVPTVTPREETPVANRPGDKPYGKLKPGDYEALWANQNYLEVVTQDSFDAWLAADDYTEAAAHHFDTEPYKLLNTSSGGPAPIRPLAKPNGEPLQGALVYRAALEKLPTPPGTPNGWVRAHVGWIARGQFDVVPKLIPAEK